MFLFRKSGTLLFLMCFFWFSSGFGASFSLFVTGDQPEFFHQLQLAVESTGTAFLIGNDPLPGVSASAGESDVQGCLISFGKG